VKREKMEVEKETERDILENKKDIHI